MNGLNFLLIITDQQRQDTLGYRKLTPCRTPNIDALFENGVSFDRCVTPSPLCTPARTSIFTGLYPHQVKGMHPGQINMMMNDQTIGDPPVFTKLLEDKGYQTDYAGKWHLGNDVIQNWFGRSGAYDTGEYSRWCKDNGISDGWAFNDNSLRSKRAPHMSIPATAVMDIDPASHGDAWIVDQSIEFIKTRDKEKPFFSVCSLNGPHPPFKIPEPYYSMYDPSDVICPPNFNLIEGKPDYIKNGYYHAIVEDFGTDFDKWRKSIAVYWGFVTMLDDQLGRLMDQLEKEGIADETMIIFVSDHGEMMGQHGLWHKMQAYEESLRVPMIFSSKQIKHSAQTEFPASLIDIAPTILSLAGIKKPGFMQGMDLTCELYEENANDGARYLFSECTPLGDFHKAVDWRMVTDNKIKYIWNRNDKDELYDLIIDPYETNNLMIDPLYKAPVDHNRKVLKQWMIDTDDPMLHEYTNEVNI